MPLNQKSSASKKYRSFSGQGTVLKRHQKSFRIKQVDKQRAVNEARYRQHVQAHVAEEHDLKFDSGGVIDDDGDWVMDDGTPFTAEIASEAVDPDEAEKLYVLLCKEIKKSTARSEPSTRRDRNERLHQGFKRQMMVIRDAYMDWAYRIREIGYDGSLTPDIRNNAAQGTRRIQMFDIFELRSVTYALLESDQGLAAALVRQGMVPCAPFAPKYAVSIRTLEILKNLRCRCPHLTIQPFVKGIMDMLGIPCQPSYHTLFSTAFDVYLEILESTRREVLKVLKRDTENWRLKNTCPGCSYKLQGEQKLAFEMLIAMDGNNSLKRIRRISNSCENASEKPQEYQRPDSRLPPGDYYISRKDVDRWSKDLVGSATTTSSEQSPCSPRWNNMDQNKQSRMWGVFDETGVFLSLCRHGFVLLVADMVQSGELSKYPLATVNALLNAFGPNLGIGYDIGCQFKTTISNTQLGELASSLNYKSLVGSFHGHAHNRLCQLSHLATYTNGLGLEDLEGCERFFSKSNNLARSIRYANVFHRQQSIVLFFRHTDNLETYANLSKFMVNNYKQAIDLLKTEPTLRSAMVAQGISNTSIFSEWLEEERAYLEGLKEEPAHDTLEMEYYQRLVMFYEYTRDIEGQRASFFNSTPETLGQPDRTRSIETKRRQLIEKRDNVLDIIHGIEQKLGIKPDERWVPSSKEWMAAAEKVRLRNYRKNLDVLESLVVARIFELSTMNMPGLGYNLRGHISKALQARSPAIKTALDKYNTSAALLSPPAPQLSWKQIVDYAFLSDFDLLRCARQDIREKPWANPTNRTLRDQYFKLERAREEIERLNVEIRRLVTYMRDEEAFLTKCESEFKTTQSHIAHQISLYRLERSRSNLQHKRRFDKLSLSAHFTGNMSPGIAIGDRQANSIPTHDDVSNDMASDDPEDESDEEEAKSDAEENESDEEDADHLIEDIAYSMLAVSLDDSSESRMD